MELRSADYRFRAHVQREVVVKAIADNAARIDYRNFKDSIDDDERIDTYMRVWATMRVAQQREMENEDQIDFGF